MKLLLPILCAGLFSVGTFSFSEPLPASSEQLALNSLLEPFPKPSASPFTLLLNDLAVFHPQPGQVDQMLRSARESPTSFMIYEATTSRADDPAFELIITSARGIDGKPETVRVMSGSMRVFRADLDRDEFTKSGGLYWSINGKEGKSRFAEPGPVIMVVRDPDGTVRWYRLGYDFRC